MRMVDRRMKKKKSRGCVKAYIMPLFFIGSFSLLLFHFSFQTFIAKDNLKRQRRIVLQGDPQTFTRPVETNISCDRTHREYDICFINGPTILDPAKSTLYAIGPTQPKHFLEKIRPYPRKWEPSTMAKTKEVTLRPGPTSPQKCDVVHNASAIVLSTGGFTGHLFHDFNEVFIPLFITVRSMSLSKHDVVLVIGKLRDSWFRKYVDLLAEFSKHQIVDLDKDNATHCFSSAIVGLVYHGFLTIDPNLMPSPTTLAHFHPILNMAYNQARLSALQKPASRPTLVLFVRTGRVGRVLLNQDQVRALAESVGFDVVVFEPKFNTPLREIFGLLSRSHVVLGVHGAAMTQLLFLRPGSILLQVVPLGLDWMAEVCYERPAKKMGLEYVEYKVRVEESSLVHKYKRSNKILKDAMRVQKTMWPFVKAIYLKHQNVTLDLIRFREYLETTYIKAKIFMDKERPLISENNS